MEIAGKTALLTGATGGLGRAIAQRFAERGAELILSSRKEAELAALAESLPHGPHRWVVSDLAQEGAAEELIGAASDADILVANAGLPGTGRLDDFDEHGIQKALRVNLEAPIMLAHGLLPRMRKRGSGHFVFISSLAGKAANPRSSIYNATKFGLRGFALGLRSDLGDGPIGSSVISPGFVRDAGMFAASGAKSPPGLGTASPDEVVKAVVDAIEQNKVETAVGPFTQRALAHLGLALPRVALLAQSSQAGQRAAESVAGGHREHEARAQSEENRGSGNG